jgi:hypothetical protein
MFYSIIAEHLIYVKPERPRGAYIVGKSSESLLPVPARDVRRGSLPQTSFSGLPRVSVQSLTFEHF